MDCRVLGPVAIEAADDWYVPEAYQLGRYRVTRAARRGRSAQSHAPDPTGTAPAGAAPGSHLFTRSVRTMQRIAKMR